ncbi:uncharacterized protein A4U43_C06F13080 [Asparagus officinalis]|uniref:Uncharacterized protein n=1 Tax=Asparagus officinalis TaxID=4686 RepID=A0A5P1ELU0_ASPOF|nr:uncharacterized protein A4U43_C06F13080 [Asparagus officinalis]
MDEIVPRMRAEHWKAYGSSNFTSYVSFGAIPSDKVTVMLLLDHLDLAMGKNEAYEKFVMLNEAYVQELVARGVDTMAIKVETEKRFTEQKHIRQEKEEPPIERKYEAEKEEGKEDEA